MTDWQITPYLFLDSFSEEEDGDTDESSRVAPQNYPPRGGASSSHYASPPSYHQQYMGEFQSIQSISEEEDGDTDESSGVAPQNYPPPGVVPTHPIMLLPRLIINSIWVNSSQSIPASAPTSKILQASLRVSLPSPPSTLGIKSASVNMRRTFRLGLETPITTLILLLLNRLFCPLQASGMMLIFTLGEG
ncbi:unnamed protein product [Lactuca saligna]|uniref:Uncharacterized protein n=1 Tax=Lactuca saligna TaxID=75948 RepID=A0AA35YVK7_LACSI|nr:unnamed protein product [Lactuca saligna]